MTTSSEQTTHERCQLCGLILTEYDEVDLFPWGKQHKDEICPISDPYMKDIIRRVTLHTGIERDMALKLLVPVQERGHGKHVVECKNCHRLFETAVWGNATSCPHCKTKQYVSKK